jgi:hypothetical protein
LSHTGRLSSDPAKALRLVDPEVATRRVQEYMAMRGWDITVMERFRLLPSPERPEVRIAYARRARPEVTTSRSEGTSLDGSAAAA